jgi:cytochrome c-type biogenesis protein
VGERAVEIVSGGPLVVAVGLAAWAGLVSFLSPCNLPLVPGYLSYVTGLAGADLADALDRPTPSARGRVLIGVGGFVAGIAAVYAVTAVLFASAGRALLTHSRAVEVAVGVVVIVLGAAFLGFVPGLQREWRLRWLPSAGLAGAPLLGVVSALSWIPCTGPTLGAVLGLAMVHGSTARAVTLVVAYCLGVGLPFLAFGLGFRKMLGLVRAVRRHNQWVTRIGGAMLVIVGLALVTGGWGDFIIWLRATVGPGGTAWL